MTIKIIFLILLCVLITLAVKFFFHGVKRNISYGENARQVMDFYKPKESVKKDSLVVFVYGGAWRSGSKNYYTYIGKFFSAQGYGTLIPDYRTYPEVQFPLFTQDVAQAVKAFEKRSGDNYKDIILVGHSAGAHMAATLAYDRSYFEKEGITSPIKSFIGLSGPYDLPFDEELTPIFETAIDNKDLTNPVALATKSPNPPSTLLLHGVSDKRVFTFHTENLTEILKNRRSPVQTYFLEDYSHIKIITTFAPLFNKFSTAPQIVSNFLLSE